MPETDPLLQHNVLPGQADHAAGSHLADESVVDVNVLLELSSAADQQPTSSKLTEFPPDQWRCYGSLQLPPRRITRSA